MSFFADVSPAQVAQRPVDRAMPRTDNLPAQYDYAAMQKWHGEFEAHLSSLSRDEALELCQAEFRAIEQIQQQFVTARLAGAVICAEILRLGLCPPQHRSAGTFVAALLSNTRFAGSATARSRLPKAGALWLVCGLEKLPQASAPDPYFPFCTLALAEKMKPEKAWGACCQKYGKIPSEREAREFVGELLGRAPKAEKKKGEYVKVRTSDITAVAALIRAGEAAGALAAMNAWLPATADEKGGEK